MSDHIKPIEPNANLVFLDIDGVLNGHDFDPVAQSNRIDRDKVDLLNFILVSTEARIVLSSAWRYHFYRAEMNLAGLDWLLRSHGVRAGSLVGITHVDTPTEWDEYTGRPTKFLENERSDQVRRWRVSHGHIGRYVVIDDLDLGFTDVRLPFVETIGAVGMTMRDATKAIRVLQAEGRPW